MSELDRFDAERFLELVERYRVDRVTVVPTMMLRIWRLPTEQRKRFDVSSLEFVMTGSAPCPAWLMRSWIEWLGPEVMHGIETYYPWWKEALDQYNNTQHMLSPTYATIDGDTAKTRTDVQATHYPKGESDPTVTLILWATYHTDMRRVDGQWKICRHELVSRGMKRG